MEARNRLLPDWLTKIRTHQIALPRFQRFQAWSHNQITSLLNNVLQELPAGAVLVLDIGDKEPFSSRPVFGAPETGERITEHLLDGQQRLTALWRSLHDHYQDRSYYVVLKEDEDLMVPSFIESYGRWDKNDQRYPLWLNNPVDLWNKRMIPVPLLRPDSNAEVELERWAEIASKGDRETEKEISREANRLRQKFATFNIPFLSLPSTTKQEVALSVFIQMNTSASPLTAYDIVVAQVEAVAEKSLHELTDRLRQESPAIAAFIEPADLMLAVTALLQDKVPNNSTYLSSGFSNHLVDVWDQTVQGVRRAVAFLEEEKVFDAKRLPSDVVLYPLSALWAEVPDGLDAEGQARHLLRKYVWRSFFTNRYERSSATRALIDYRQLRGLLRGSPDQVDIFDGQKHPLPTIEEIKLAGWPIRKDRLARAILAVSLRSNGLDFADGTPVSRENLKKREYHHLFPNAWLSRHGYGDEEIYRSLNCGLVSWRTNRTISDKSPSQYLDERMEAAILGEDEVRHRLESHLIPFNPIKDESYEEFLHQRAVLICDEMTKLCS
ncbi:MAG: DUF262 domain-containing protein [Pyrinomonadaceae bacterium]